MDGTQSTHNSPIAIMGRAHNHENIGSENYNEVEVLNKTRVMCLDVVLRVLGMVVTLVGAIVVGVDTQTKVIQVQPQPNLPLMNIHIHAKWHYLSAFVYFVVANSIASVYALISLLLSLASAKSSKKGLVMVITTLDLAVVALLFSATGTSATVGVIAYNGNSHVQWNKICNMFERFCGQLMVGSVFSGIGAVVFFLLVLLSFFKNQIKN